MREHKDEVWSHIRFTQDTNVGELLTVIKQALRESDEEKEE